MSLVRTITLALAFAAPTKRAAAVSSRAPSIRRPADSIYALAVDSNDYRSYPFVYLLDEGSVRLDADGRGSRTYRQVIQILRPAGVARWAEQRVAYQPDREKVVVNWMRVLRPDGSIISDKPTLSQTSDVAASTVNPVYTETRVIRYSLANVAPGTLVDLSWTVETTNPPLPGDMLSAWNFSTAAPAMRSHFALDVPDGMTPRVIETHLDFSRSESHRDGRHLFEWYAQHLVPPRGEIFAPDSSVPAMSVRVSAPITWSTIGHWYNGLARDRYVLTPALVSEVDSIVRPARTRDDTIDLLHRWIAKDLRYVSVSLGIGGYQPRFPEATVGTGYGDCKDKATLFIAAARHFGIMAYPVLLNSDGGADSTLPAIEQFNHVIAAMPARGNAGYTYLDLTTYEFRDGAIPPSYQGAFGLLVHPDGSSQDITFPKDSAGTSDEIFRGALTPGGKVSGMLSLTASGAQAAVWRAALSTAPDSAELDNLRRRAPKPYPDMTVDTVSVHATGPTPPGIDYVMSNGDGAKSAGQVMILTIPAMFRAPVSGFQNVIEVLKRDPTRDLPIDATKTLGVGTGQREFRLTLPEGWKATLPDSVIASSPFGTFRSVYTQTGRELRIVHSASGGHGVYPPSDAGALLAWFEKMASDDAQFIVLSRSN